MVAPREDRIAGLVERRGLGPEEAAEAVDRVDVERAGFMRHHYGRDLADPASFDLVINTSTFPVPRAVELVVTAWRARSANP